jgi:limonene-1,2-epoxide hydrolase
MFSLARCTSYAQADLSHACRNHGPVTHRERLHEGEGKMPTSTEIVLNFLDQCGKGKAQLQDAFRTYFTSNTIWENVGLVATRGVDEALAIVDKFELSAGIAHFDVDMLAIAVEGDRVLTERVDRLLTSKGDPVFTLRVMGIFELVDGKIAAWRDYFDPSPLKG